MKNVMLALFIGPSLLIACQQPEKPAEESKAPEAMPTFAYEIEHPADNWTPGKLEHVASVLNSLKAFENGDIDASMEKFADSVEVAFDGFEAKMSRDSLKAMLAKNRAMYKSLTITMGDWESVISKDGKEEYVSLWYKEKWTDTKGATDSIEVMDDLRIEQGKIASLNEKSRRYGKK